MSAVVDLIQGWVNPFTEKRIILTSPLQRHPPRDITCDLIKAHEVSENAISSSRMIG